MKSYQIVLLVVLLSVAGAAGIMAASKRTRRFDDQITLRKDDKVPYGYYVLHRMLPAAFPQATFTYSKNDPASWAYDTDETKNVFFFNARYLDPTDEELESIAALAAAGNDVFFVCNNPSAQLEAFFGVSTVYTEGQFSNQQADDSPRVQLTTPVFAAQNFTYPGRAYYTPLTIDTPNKVLPLGRINNTVYFVGGQVGKGKMYLHTAPLLLSNYFLLYRNNAHYLSALAGLMSKDVKEIVWSDYYLLNTNRNYKEPSWLGVLWKYEAFRWGLGLIAVAALLYLILNSQRKQRPLPVPQPVVNDSLEYVSTIGSLYYHQGDGANLVAKMKQHLSEGLRTRYFIDLNAAGNDAAALIAQKTGYPLPDVQDLLYHLNANLPPARVDEADLQQVYHRLQKFYKHTH